MPPGEDVSTRLFRAVSRAALDDVIAFGGFRQKPGGLSYEGKLLTTSIDDAATFGCINYRLDASVGLDIPFHIVEIRVPSFFVSQFESHMLDFMLAVYIAEDLLPLLNRHGVISEIDVIPYGRL